MYLFLGVVLAVLLTALPAIVSTDVGQRRSWAIFGGGYLSVLLIAGVSSYMNPGDVWLSRSDDFFLMVITLAPFTGMAGFILLALRLTRLTARTRTTLAAIVAYSGYLILLSFSFGLIGG